jgi:hypothetical protein
MNKRYVAAALLALTATPLAVAMGAFGCNGGGAQGGCPESTSCGGDIVGFWQAHDYCQFSPTQPSQPINVTEYTARPQDPMVAPPQPLVATNGDWCSGLFYPAPGKIYAVTLWHDVPTFKAGSVEFDANPNLYKTNLVLQTHSQTHFALACLQAGGFSPTCDQLQTDLTAFYVAAGSQKYLNVGCAAADDHGCDCSYVYELDVLDQGTWYTKSDVLYENSETYTYNGKVEQTFQPLAPEAVDYCASSDNLVLTGDNGSSLAGLLGLQKLTFKKGQAPTPPTPPTPPVPGGGDGGM